MTVYNGTALVGLSCCLDFAISPRHSRGVRSAGITRKDPGALNWQARAEGQRLRPWEARHWQVRPAHLPDCVASESP